MKKVLTILLLATVFACSKKADAPANEENTEEFRAPYDTIAVDSFSTGATLNNTIIKRDTLPRAKDTIKSVKKENAEKLVKTESDKKDKNPKLTETKTTSPKSDENQPQ